MFTTLPTEPSNSPSGRFREVLDQVLGPTMFFLGLATLVLGAGVIHRLGHGDLSAFEAKVLLWGTLVLWPVFVLEGLLRLAVCRSEAPWGWRLARFVGVCLAPPLRLAGRGYAAEDKVWLPGLGWSAVDQQLRTRLERQISVPMIAVALLVLPFVAMEYFWLEPVRASFALSLVLDIGTAVIWLAFALEFIVMASLAEDKIVYCVHHWMDLAVVALPLVEFLPILRLLRLTSLLEIQQVSRLGRLYRLRSLLAKLWRGVLLLEMLQRLLGRRDANRLGRLKKLLAARQGEISELSKEITKLEEQLAKDNMHAVSAPTVTVPIIPPSVWSSETRACQPQR